MGIAKWWKVIIILHEDPSINILAWKQLVRGRKKSRMYMTVFFGTILSIWFSRNNQMFENKDFSIEKIIEGVKLRTA